MDSDVLLMRVVPLLDLETLRHLRCVNKGWQVIVDDCLDPSLKSIIRPLAETLGKIGDLAKNKFDLDVTYDMQNRRFELKFHSCDVCLRNPTPCKSDVRQNTLFLDLDAVHPSEDKLDLEKRQTTLRVFQALHSIMSRVFPLEKPTKSCSYSLHVYTHTLESIPKEAADERQIMSGNGSLLLCLLRKFCCFLYERPGSYESAYNLITQVPNISVKKQLLLDLVTLCVANLKWDLVWRACEDLGKLDKTLTDYLHHCKRYYDLIMASSDNLRQEDVADVFRRMETLAINNSDYLQASSDLHMLVQSLNKELKLCILDKMVFSTNLSEENFNFIYSLFAGDQDLWNFMTQSYLKDHPPTDICYCNFLLMFLRHIQKNPSNQALQEQLILAIHAEQEKFSELLQIPQRLQLAYYTIKEEKKIVDFLKSVQTLLPNPSEQIEAFKSFYLKCLDQADFEHIFLHTMTAFVNDNADYSLEQKTSFFLPIYKTLASKSLIQGIKWLSRIPNLKCKLPKLLRLAVSFFRLIGWFFKS